MSSGLNRLDVMMTFWTCYGSAHCTSGTIRSSCFKRSFVRCFDNVYARISLSRTAGLRDQSRIHLVDCWYVGMDSNPSNTCTQTITLPVYMVRNTCAVQL